MAQHRRVQLTGSAAIAAVLTFGLMPYQSATAAPFVELNAGCSKFEVAGGACSSKFGGSIGGNAVDLRASQSKRSGGGSSVGGARPSTSRSGATHEADNTSATRDDDWWTNAHGDQYTVETHNEDPKKPGEPRAITLADLKSFRPSAGHERSEPKGWSVVGLNTNFIADGGVQVRTGSLLGRPAAVRFTPAGYQWNYGDGDSASRTTPGATWKALNLREFDKTPTSHEYDSRGKFTVALTVTYTAEYQFAGSPWIPVAGTVQDAAAPMSMTVTTADTVLVDKDCAKNPHGPGC